MLLGHLNGQILQGISQNNDLSVLKTTAQMFTWKNTVLNASKALKSQPMMKKALQHIVNQQHPHEP
jgi:hypothetical protein